MNALIKAVCKIIAKLFIIPKELFIMNMNKNLNGQRLLTCSLMILIFITSFSLNFSSEKDSNYNFKYPKEISNPESAEHTYLDLTEDSTLSLTLIKMKEITLTYFATVVRYKIEVQSVVAGATCEIRMDDGSQFDMIGGSGSWTYQLEDELTGSFPVGTRFSIWLKSWDLFEENPAYCRDFNITTYQIPHDFTITASDPICYDGGCVLSWDDVTGAFGYQVQQSTTVDGEYTDLGSFTTFTSFSMSSGSPMTRFYRVIAMGLDGNSTSNSVEVQYKLPDPFTIATNESVSYDGTSRITWSDVTGASLYILKESSTFDGIYNTIESTTELFIDITQPYAQTNFYKILAQNGVGTTLSSNYLEIEWGNPNSFTIATNESVCYDGTSRINWSSVFGADSYQLQESTAFNGMYFDLGSSTTNLYVDITKGSSQTRYYKVKAINAVGSTLSTNYLEINWAIPSTPIISTSSQTIYTDEISIEWSDTVTGASEVNLQKSMDGITFTDISGASSSPTLETGLSEDIYYYRVRATNAIDSVYSEEIEVNVTKPESFMIATTENICYDGTSRITWSVVTGATSYQLQECTTSDGIYSNLGESTANVYVDVTKYSSQTLYYKVKANNSIGETLSSNYIEIIWTVPAVPTIFTPNQTIYNNEISITWNDFVTGASEVNLQRSIDGTSFTDISSATSSPTLDTGLSEDIYFYRVRATNAIGSVFSEEIEINVTTPESFTIDTTERVCYDGTSRITWSVVTGATSYQLQECTTSNGIYSNLGAPTAIFYVDINKSFSQTLYYKIKAINSVGETISSNFLEIIWAVPETPIISTLNQTIYISEINIVWSAEVTGASEVNLQKSMDGVIFTDISEATSSPFVDTGLSESVYYYRVEAVNEIDSIYSELCEINVSLQPEISEEDDVEFQFGAPVFNIEWSVFDSHPDQYQFIIDGIGQPIQEWTNETFLNYNVGSFNLGMHNITLKITDAHGNWNEDSVNFHVVDKNVPTINHPQDITYILGEVSNNIEWEVFDQNPYQYQIIIDGVEQDLLNWNGENIIVNVDNLSLGSHNVTLVVFDTEGNWSQDDVNIAVIPKEKNGIPGYSLTLFIISTIISIIIIMNKQRYL